jgi:hypothetical protein
MSGKEWKNPAYFKRCHGKRPYSSMKKAEIRAQRISLETGKLVIAYLCCDCERIHIGHADHSQQLAHPEFADPQFIAQRIAYQQFVDQQSIPIPNVDGNCLYCGNAIPSVQKKRAKRGGWTALYCSASCKQLAADRRREIRHAQARRQEVSALEDDQLSLTAAQQAEFDRHLASLDQDRRGGATWTALKAELEQCCP